MEGNFLFDIDQVIQNISEAEVMSVFFPTFRRALIVDTRANESVGPFVRLMPMARSPQDRMRSIRRLRPQFPRPTNLTLIPWQRYVDSLVESGVWDQIVDRVRQSGDESDGRLMQRGAQRASSDGTRRACVGDYGSQLSHSLACRVRVTADHADGHRGRQARTQTHSRREEAGSREVPATRHTTSVAWTGRLRHRGRRGKERRHERHPQRRQDTSPQTGPRSAALDVRT